MGLAGLSTCPSRRVRNGDALEIWVYDRPDNLESHPGLVYK